MIAIGESYSRQSYCIPSGRTADECNGAQTRLNYFSDSGEQVFTIAVEGKLEEMPGASKSLPQYPSMCGSISGIAHRRYSMLTNEKAVEMILKDGTDLRVRRSEEMDKCADHIVALLMGAGLLYEKRFYPSSVALSVGKERSAARPSFGS